MGLYDSYEEDVPRSPSSVINSAEDAKKLFDDPTYVTGKNVSPIILHLKSVKAEESHGNSQKVLHMHVYITVVNFNYNNNIQDHISPERS